MELDFLTSVSRVNAVDAVTGFFVERIRFKVEIWAFWFEVHINNLFPFKLSAHQCLVVSFTDFHISVLVNFMFWKTPTPPYRASFC